MAHETGVDEPVTDHGPKEHPAGDRTYRRAALISTAIAVPVAVLAAFLFTAGSSSKDSSGSSSSGPQPPLTIPAIAPNPRADADCAKVFTALPVTLNGLAPRIVRSTSTYITAWGNPAVVLECGVARPAGLTSGSGAFVLDTGVQWLPVQAENGSTTLTSIDRSVYIQVQLPKTVGQSPDVLPALTKAISSVLPAICSAQAPLGSKDQPLASTLCVNRK